MKRWEVVYVHDMGYGEHVSEDLRGSMAFHHVALESASELLVLTGCDRSIRFGTKPVPHRRCIIPNALRGPFVVGVAVKFLKPLVPSLVDESRGIGVREEADRCLPVAQRDRAALGLL